jgi:hypothetical protein
MLQTGFVRALAWCRPIGLAVVFMVAGAVPAVAQYSPPPRPAVGEDYHFEIAYSFWSADPSLVISSESLGIPGTDVDLVDDLGIESKQMRRLNIVLRPAQKHKFRFEYTPVKYETEAFPVQREFIFNGQRYRVGLPVSTVADFKTYRFGYEYDFISRSRGYLGVLLDLKYTDVSVELTTPATAPEFTSQAAPVPTIGFTGRGYVAPNVAVGGEVSFFRVPDNLSDTYDGSYTDYDFYGLVNFNKNFGAQVGYRSIDIFYEADVDRGALKFKGWYFGGTARF